MIILEASKNTEQQKNLIKIEEIEDVIIVSKPSQLPWRIFFAMVKI